MKNVARFRNGLTPNARQRAVQFIAFVPALFVAASAFAQSENPGAGIYVQAGRTVHSARNTNDASVGLVVPWSTRTDGWSVLREGYWDIFASQWDGPSFGGRRTVFTQVGVIPTLRYRFDERQSAWFAEAGLGVSFLDGIYGTPDRIFSSRFNFSEVLALGRNFGPGGNMELALRLQHFSNGGIHQPNPGENFVQLRYTVRF